MQSAELERYLHEHIPLSRAMAVSVVSVEESAGLLSAPLGPNVNHRETVFGGSASALAILAAWSLLHARLRSEGSDSRLVIQRNTMEYLKPIVGEFTARSSLDQPGQWQRFTRMLARKGKARVAVSAALEHSAPRKPRPRFLRCGLGVYANTMSRSRRLSGASGRLELGTETCATAKWSE